MIKASSQATINHPADRIDLAEWLSTLTDQDYQSCSRSHLAAGTYRDTGGWGMVNVESIGGHLMVQHYRAGPSLPHRVVMRSDKTRVYALHLVPVAVEVVWIQEIEPRDDRTATYRCTVEVRMSRILDLAVRLMLLPTFLRRHIAEETVLYARDIGAKVGKNEPSANGRWARVGDAETVQPERAAG
jgi:hypothetical protein